VPPASGSSNGHGPSARRASISATARLLLDFAFHVVGVHRIEARARVDNLRSNMALRTLGARNEGTLRAAFICDGQFVDQHLWAIVGGLEWVRPRNLGDGRV
jgi:ribosomal-protein-serine acetyltransferase